MGLPPVITIEKTDGGFPITITLDYGDGTELLNGRIISGTITIVVSAPPRTDGATRTVTRITSYNVCYTKLLRVPAVVQITHSISGHKLLPKHDSHSVHLLIVQ